jgi:ATP-binding protein involved in chromosome partitioning
VQLTVCQEVQLSGVVSVLTPSALAWTDALKGLEMFSSMGIKTICAVENMAFFTV